MSGPRLYINTYAPLITSTAGVRASDRQGIPPFVDGSIRREPDLESEFPSISCLCRCGHFAPRLREGDHVIYMARKARYRKSFRHWRMTALLRVIKLFDSHAQAAAWYRAQRLPLPGNCMVPDNRPLPLSKSHERTRHAGCTAAKVVRDWDATYQDRANRYPRFVVCGALWRDLSWDAPVVREEDLRAVFRRVPGSRNPGALPLSHLTPLLDRLGIPAEPSSP